MLFQKCFTRCKYYKIKYQIKNISSTSRIISKDNLPVTAYKHEIVMKGKYGKWENNGLFRAEVLSQQPKFSMILPPPNVTGKLHLGHALTCTIQDVIARRQRSLGYNVLWIPGTDHAGIATQGIVERYLENKDKTNRHNLGREKFINEVWKWKSLYGNTIAQQLQTLGCSLDWSRQVFTMDQKYSDAVNVAFITLYKRGLIFRKKALVNWCNKLKSTLSDIEIDNMNIDGPTDLRISEYEKPVKFGVLYDFAYKIVDSNEEIVISTTTPETMLGDMAIAVNPHDTRYIHLKGKRVIHPFRKTTIPIIFEDFVDMKFGTGAVKITPAHSKIDYEVAERHKLQMLQVLDENLSIINGGQFNKLNKYECREKILQKLNELGLSRGTRSHAMSLPVCSRTGDIIEQLPKEQWFLSCRDIVRKATQLVQDKTLDIFPEKFVKNWLQWDDRDWCISRQLWWGHQIPAYKCYAEGNIIWVAANDSTSAKIQASEYFNIVPDKIEAERDTDVLDTWFSSGIYPLASLGWPDCNNKDFQKFYPLNLMSTGHDILGFWVQRMVMLGLELTGTLPFNKILAHAIICDNKGAKMSKSRGNVIDPIDVINGISMEDLKSKTERMHKDGILNKDEMKKALRYHKSNFSNHQGIPECGVDALRFTLLSQNIKSHFINFDVEQCHANKLFCNKIWQSIIYLQRCFSQLNIVDTYEYIKPADLTFFDKWILSRLANMVNKVNESMVTYDFHIATKAMRTFIYNEFCDVYLETTKPDFQMNIEKNMHAHAHTLSAALNTSLRCLAPFMIYLTDELIPKIPSFESNIIFNFNDDCKYYEFPQYVNFKQWNNEELENRIDRLLDAINIIRQLKVLYSMTNKIRPTVWIDTNNEIFVKDIHENNSICMHLSKCDNISFNKITNKKYISAILDADTKINVELLGDDIHKAISFARIKVEKKIKKIEESLNKLNVKMAHPSKENDSKYDLELIRRKKEELKQLQRLIVD